MRKVVFCADIGTSSLKAALIGFEGEVFAFSRVQFKLLYTDFASSEWFQSLRDALSSCLLSVEQDFMVVAFCISGNGPTLCGREGQTLLWNEELPAELKSLDTKSLYIPRISGFKKKFSSYWNKKDSLVFSGPEYLIFLLTGKAVSILPESRYGDSYWSLEALEGVSFSKEEAESILEKLPPFVFPSSVAGTLSKDAVSFLCNGNADERRIKEGIPVICGAPDFISALVGTNTLQEGKICDRAGSSEGINLCTSKPVFADGVRTLPSIIPGLWNASVLIPQSGQKFNAYREKICRLAGRDVSFDETVKFFIESDGSVPELDQGKYLMLQTALSVKDALLLLENAFKNQMEGKSFAKKMTVTGGQAENELWNQMKADVTGYELHTQRLLHAELTGDAVFALVGLGVYKDIKGAAEILCKKNKTYSPSFFEESEFEGI